MRPKPGGDNGPFSIKPAIDRPQRSTKMRKNKGFHGFESWPSFIRRAKKNHEDFEVQAHFLCVSLGLFVAIPAAAFGFNL